MQKEGSLEWVNHLSFYHVPQVHILFSRIHSIGGFMRKICGMCGGEILIGTSLSTDIPQSYAVEKQVKTGHRRTKYLEVKQNTRKQGTDQSSLMSQPCSCVSYIKHVDTPSLPSHPTSGSLSTNFFCQSCSFLLSWLINPSPFSHLRVSVKSPKRTCPLKIITTLLPPTSEPPIAFQLCYKTNNLYFKVAN